MKAFVLTTIINGRKNYVANFMGNRSSDNKKIVNYTTDVSYVNDFGSEAAAEDFIQHIVNPHERQYTAETIEVNESQLKPVRELTEENIK
jgi:hypothetical protein